MQVSDIFQFIVASNSMDIAPEDAEVVASSKSRSNGSLRRALPHDVLLPGALLLALASLRLGLG